MNDQHITILCADSSRLEDIQAMLRAAASARVSAVACALNELGHCVDRLRGGILIAECEGESAGELAPLERLADAGQRPEVLLVCRRQSPEFLLQAMRVGVKEVLPWPFDAQALQAALLRLREKAGAPAAPRAKVLAFASCKGGSGASFLAANLAGALADQGAAVALIDLNLQFGDAHLFVTDDEAAHTLSDIVRSMHRLDAALLKASMLAARPGLSVLAAPGDPAQRLEVRPEHIESLLSLARRHFDWIVVDLGRTVDAATIKALDHADRIHAVLQPSLPCARAARRLLELFRDLEYEDRKIELVLNRYARHAALPMRDIEAALGLPIARVIPNDYGAVMAALNQGVPLVQANPGSPATVALREWSMELLGRGQRERGEGWVARMLQRLGRNASSALGMAAGA